MFRWLGQIPASKRHTRVCRRAAVAAILLAVCWHCADAQIIEKPPAWDYTGTQDGSKLGHSVSVAGDVNGDGYSDVIIGEHRATWGESAEGRAYLYYGSANGLGAVTRVTLEENQKGAWLGFCVSTAGDVNGDGYHDVVVGAPLYNRSSTYIDEGAVFLYLGSADGLVKPAHQILHGNQADARFGHAVSTAGDVNGDGYDDVIVGAPYYGIASVNDGRVFLFYGSEQGLVREPAWSKGGGQRYCGMGSAVATAGDVNGDGYSDVLMSAPLYDSGVHINTGVVYAYYGSDSGLADTPDWSDGVWFSEVQYGKSIASAGDVNGDGYADILVGIPLFGIAGGRPQGRFYLYYGSADGLREYFGWTDNVNIPDAEYGTDVSTAGDVNGDGYSDIIISGPGGGFALAYLGSKTGPLYESRWSAGQLITFGTSLCTAGDVNGDGLSDVIVGAPGYAPIGLPEGRVFVYHGAAERSELLRPPTKYVYGSQRDARFGHAVASAGDVDGDGCEDVIAGAYLHDGGAGEAGAVYLYRGGGEGLHEDPAWSRMGTRPGEWFGWDLDGAGDVNGDGYGDFLVGAPRYSNGEFDEGAAFLFAGSKNGPGQEPLWQVEGDQDGAQMGFRVARAGDVNGDGFSDLLVSAYRADGAHTDEGCVSLYLGDPWRIGRRADWMAYGGQEGAWFGYSIATAGDLNGDGLSDVIIGAPRYDTAVFDEGRVFVYLGTPNGGLTGAPVWTYDGMQVESHFGSNVAGAGDALGDGYGDILVTEDNYISGPDAKGRVVFFNGSQSGLPDWPDWAAYGEQRESGFGTAIGAAGDINNDGYGDIFISRPERTFTGALDAQVLIYAGSPDMIQGTPVWESVGYSSSRLGQSVCAIRNVRGTLSTELLIGAPRFPRNFLPVGAFIICSQSRASFNYFVPRQLRTATGDPVAPNGISGSDDSFSLRVAGRLPFGRSSTVLEWEVKPFGTPFTGAGLGRSEVFDPDLPDSGHIYQADLEGVVMGLVPGEAYHWRVRQRHKSPFLPPRTGWAVAPGPIEHEPDLRMGSIPEDPQLLPIRMTLFQNSPNPFNPGTTISFWLSKDVWVEMVIYDVLGRTVKEFPARMREAGVQEQYWDGTNDHGALAASGVYFLRLEVDGALATRKLVLIR